MSALHLITATVEPGQTIDLDWVSSYFSRAFPGLQTKLRRRGLSSTVWVHGEINGKYYVGSEISVTVTDHQVIITCHPRSGAPRKADRAVPYESREFHPYETRGIRQHLAAVCNRVRQTLEGQVTATVEPAPDYRSEDALVEFLDRTNWDSGEALRINDNDDHLSWAGYSESKDHRGAWFHGTWDHHGFHEHDHVEDWTWYANGDFVLDSGRHCNTGKLVSLHSVADVERRLGLWLTRVGAEILAELRTR